MKAWVLNDIGRIELTEVADPVRTYGEALVRIRAAGICGSDIPRIFDTGAHKMPLIIGHEFAGEIVEIWDEANDSHTRQHESGAATDSCDNVTKLMPGDRVGIYPLIACKKCPACQNGHPEMCRNYDYLGSRRDGGFAEYVSVPIENLVKLPEEVSFESAAMLEPTAVAWHAVRQGIENASRRAETERNAVVIGLGTIGLLICMILRSMDYRVMAIGNHDTQCDKALKCGIKEADILILGAKDSNDEAAETVTEWITSRNDGRGADLVFECVGKSMTYEQAVSLADTETAVVLVGNPASDMTLPRNIYWQILRRQIKLVGTWNSTYLGKSGDDWDQVIAAIVEKKIDPKQLITHRLSIDEMIKGFEIMRKKSEDYTKIMMII